MKRCTMSFTRRYSDSSSIRMAEYSSVSRSRTSFATRPCSRYTTAGHFDDSTFRRISSQMRLKYTRSATMSASGLVAAAVRMMTPPVKPSDSRNVRTMPRSRLRSSRASIFLDTPTWSTVGMNTRNRPAIVACEVSRAPLVPSGSLTTCTRISWPALSSVSILGSSPLPRPAPASAAGASASSPSSSPPSMRSKVSIVSTTSDT